MARLHRWQVCVGLGVAACSFAPRGQDPDALAGDPDAAAIDAIDAPPAVDATDAPPAIDGGPTTGRTLVDDSAADFGQGPPGFVETRVEAAGAVAPRAYYLGSLCAAGNDSLLFTDGRTATGAVLPASPTRVGLARTVDLSLGNGAAPAGVGITSGTDWTLWWTGEVFLAAGARTLTLRADDHGILELQAPGEDGFTKILGVNHGDQEQSAPYLAATTGWYGVRLAVAQRNGPVELYARVDGQPILRRRTRCRVDGYRGLAQTGFDEAQFLDVAATTIDQGATAANTDWGFGAPSDLGVTAADTFSVRWAGQVFIAVAGPYRLRVRSDDGHRLWLDGQRVVDDTSDGIHDVTTGELTLGRGWHDLVYDVTESGGGARAQLTVASGPELVGQPFPPERLRPAEGRAERFESATAPSIAEPGPAMFGFEPATGAVITAVDVGYALEVADFSAQVTTTLRNATTASILRNSSTGDTTDRFHPIAFDGEAVATAWGLGFDVAGNGGTLTRSWLTLHHRDAAGTGPTPTAASYQSSVRDLLVAGATEIAAIDRIAFDTRAALGATVTIALRTCDAPDACAAEPYSIGYASGAVPTVAARRYLQYQVRFVTDGDHEPAVERVQLDYQTR